MSTKTAPEFIWPVYVGGPVEGMKNSPISYHVMEDGVYCRKNIFGDKYIFFKTEKIDGLPKGKAEVSPLVEKKIPYHLLTKTVEFFKYVISHFSSSLEAFVIYGYNRKEDKYFMYVPEQTISGGHVDYNIEDFHEKYPNSYIVGDAHSHNTMGAFWSATDNADDKKRNRYSVVIGKLNKYFPEIKCRFSYEAKHDDLEIDVMFGETDNYLEVPAFEEAIKMLKETRATVVVTSSYGYQTGHAWDTYMNSRYGHAAGHGTSQGGYYGKGANQGKGNTPFSKKEEPQTSGFANGTAKCSRCGKFNTLKNMYVDANATLCEACFTATNDFLSKQDTEGVQGLMSGPNKTPDYGYDYDYGDWGVYG